MQKPLNGMSLVKEIGHQHRIKGIGELRNMLLTLVGKRVGTGCRRRLHYCYHRPWRRSVQSSVLYSPFAKRTILVPVHEDICKGYGYFEADASLQTKHNNPIVFIFLTGSISRTPLISFAIRLRGDTQPGCLTYYGHKPGRRWIVNTGGIRLQLGNWAFTANAWERIMNMKPNCFKV
jgi:hypothetical protein